MDLYSRLKKNSILRRSVKRLKNYREFLADASDFNRYYLESAERRGDFRYRLLWLVHSLEKGMCAETPRPFGENKVKVIANIIKKHPEFRDDFEYRLASSMLRQWKSFHEEHGWAVEAELAEFINSLNADYEPGSDLLDLKDSCSILSRRSVRDFQEKELRDEDVDFALDYFRLAPTACNRQMCRIYRVKSDQAAKLLKDKLLGLSGFNLDAVNFFLVTYDIAAFEFFGERNQGYLNAGLTAMNFVNGLHLRGVGSCFLQWSNSRRDDKLVRKALGLPASERIGVVIGAGYYKDGVKTPKSIRKENGLLYREI